ncbi:MAG TPA: hypothetical protein PKD45_07470 [Flavobacteriales bacterium]|nr:hypothetical protein [Flavobacteriales bacterium]
MSEDSLYLLGCGLLFGLTLCLRAIRSPARARTVVVNLALASLYSGLFLYAMLCHGDGGSSFVWLVYWMAALVLHSLVNLYRAIWPRGR